MAYKQSPGRGNRAKTGHGVPSAFMQQKPNYQGANIEETESKLGTGASYAAGKALSDYPAQRKHVIKNLQTDAATGTKSYETKINAKNAVEQIQVARDSMAYLGGIKDPKERERKGVEFSFSFSPNSKSGKAQINSKGGEYQGPGGVSGSQEDKKKILQNLRVEGVSSSNRPDMAQKTFGIGAVPKAEEKNKISGAKKKSPVKQMETINKVVSKAKEIGSKIVGGIKKMDKALEGNSDTRSYERSDTVLGRRAVGAQAGKKASPAKMKVSKKTAYDIKEASNQKLKPGARKHYAENAQAAMKNKKTPAKMKKC